MLLPFGADAIQRVATGESEFAVSQVSEILANPGVTLAGPLPAALQSSTTYAAAPLVRGQAAEAAAAYVRFLATPAVVARLPALGFEAPG